MGWRGKLVSSRFAAAATVAILIGGLAAGPSSPAAAQILIVGNDEKQGWDENAKPIFREPGKDTADGHRYFQTGHAANSLFDTADEFGGRPPNQPGSHSIG
jgi:hypothetical protein